MLSTIKPGGKPKIIEQKVEPRFKEESIKEKYVPPAYAAAGQIQKIDDKNSNFDIVFFLAELKQDSDEMMVQILKDYGSKITEYRDVNGFSLLHHAVLQSKEGKVKKLIDYAKNENSASNEEIEIWVNAKTNDHQWTALHFSSFTGHLDSAYALIENRADIFSLNVNNQNMLHVAAQGDSAATLYLFWLLGIDINARDKKGSTPLIWASFTQSETVLQYILNFTGPKIDSQDNDGNTALHFAVKTAEEMETTRMVRSLLMYGAKTLIMNHKGETPEHITQGYEDPSNVTRISSLLQNAGSIQLKFKDKDNLL